jgi:HAE1 family hydrophobic/amphiphilic exporter-1
MTLSQSKTLSTWAIRNPIPPIVLFLVLTFAGLYAYNLMPINNMPSVVVPIVTVSITQPGAAPAEMETQITRKIEGALAGIQGVKNVNSVIIIGNSTTTLEFHLDTSFDRAMNDTRDAVATIREQLPRSILEPLIQRLEIDGGAVVSYTVEAPELSPEELSWFVDDNVGRDLLSLRGVAKVERQGGLDHEITINLDPAKLAAYGLTASDISRQLAVTHLDLPGGRVLVGGSEYTVRTLASTDSVALLRAVELPLKEGNSVKLSEIATIIDGGAEARTLTHLDGKPAVSFAVFRSKGSSEVTVAKKVAEKLEIISKNNPGITFKKIFSLAQFTENSFKSTMFGFFEGTALTILVVFLFLRDRRGTFIAALAIPLSIIPTFLVMYLLGFGLNGVSLLAISLVTGVLVDDAIVEIENIHRHMKEGKGPFEAAMIAADEIGLAVVATTLVICAVFIPVSFMPGIPGQFFKQFGLTVAVAAFFSLVVARLLTPMLAAYLMKPIADHDHEKPSGPWQQGYLRLVTWTLGNRYKTLGLAVLVMVGSFGMLPFIPAGFIPYEDFSQSQLKIELPRGTPLAQTDQVAQQIAKILKKRPEVQYVLTTSGEVAGGVNQADITIKLVPVKERDLDQREFEAEILPDLQKIPDIRLAFANSSGQKDVSIALLGDDPALLAKTAEAVEREMRTLSDITSIQNSQGLKQPELVIRPDFAKAAQLGITVQQISDAVNIALIGDIDANLAKFNQGTRQIPIRVRLPVQDFDRLDIIQNLKIPTRFDTMAPLSAFADIAYSTGPTRLERYNRQRKIALDANLNGAALGQAMDKIKALPSLKNLPAGIRLQDTGDAEIMAELFAGFATAIFAGLLMVYAIQVLLYKDWLQPLTRMAALPLSIGGAFFALLVTGTQFNMPALIGILMLMGIADKNAILLVDYMLDKIHAGIPRQQAIMEACIVRARPIIMTSLAMLAGMVPIALGLGLDSAFRAPMAIAVIGGLLSSTALSLIFVPVLFSLVREFEEWLVPKLRGFVGGPTQENPENLPENVQSLKRLP